MDCLRTVIALAASAAATGCADPETIEEGFITPTEVAVDPLDFRGDVGCSVHDGAMKSYVMTLFDYENAKDETPFTIGSTVPTPCSLFAGFRSVIQLGHVYTADVDAYDIPVELLEPFGDGSSGARQMRHVETGDIVVPRWTTHCGGSAATGVESRSNRRVAVRPCDPLIDAAPTPTALAIPPSAVLGSDPCSVAASYGVSFDSGGLPPTTGIACDGDGAIFDATAGTHYRIYATTVIDGAFHGTECLATGRSGETVTPSCSPLSANGNVDLFVDDPLVCPPGSFFDILDATLGTLNNVPIACSAHAQIGPFGAGIRLFEIAVYDAQGMTVGAGTDCAADVLPGKVVTATCL